MCPNYAVTIRDKKTTHRNESIWFQCIRKVESALQIYLLKALRCETNIFFAFRETQTETNRDRESEKEREPSPRENKAHLRIVTSITLKRDVNLSCHLHDR